MDPAADKSDVELRVHFLKWMEQYIAFAVPQPPCYAAISTQLTELEEIQRL